MQSQSSAAAQVNAQPPSQSPSQARSLALSYAAWQDLYFFARYMFAKRRGYRWQGAAHHRVVCDALMRVLRGESTRLIINIPPRYSKTELAVVNFMAWALGLHPDAEFIYTSYSARLAANHAWQTRELVQHAAYRSLFPAMRLRQDSRAKDEWRTSAGGVVYAVGAGGSITGYGAGKERSAFGGAIIIDDPHKADESKSPIMRQSVIDWFQTTLESRKNSPRTPIILIMQRLHENDLAGWLLAGNNGEQWEHVSCPAINTDGSALWPQKHDLATLRRMEQAAPYVFAGQYLQRPAPIAGGMIKPEHIEVIDALPLYAASSTHTSIPTPIPTPQQPALPGMEVASDSPSPSAITWIRAWDLAATVDGDYTVGAKLGRLPDGRLLIADIVRLRCAPDARDAAIRNTAARDGSAVRISIAQDPGQAGKTQTLYLARQLAGYRLHTSPESGDKVTRAEPLAAQINVGNVLMLRAAWNESLINEMRLFPNARHDDQIDALSRAYAQLLSSSTGMLEFLREQVASKPSPQPPSSGRGL